MKTYKLHTVDSDGNLIEETVLEIKEGSILIQQLPEGATHEMAASCHRLLTDSLKKGSEVLTTFNGIQFKVLEIK